MYTKTMNTNDYKIDSGKPVKLDSFLTRYEGKITKEEGAKIFADLIARLQALQNLLYADGSKAILVVLQAMDAAGKDSTIGNVFGPINPQG